MGWWKEGPKEYCPQCTIDMEYYNDDRLSRMLEATNPAGGRLCRTCRAVGTATGATGAPAAGEAEGPAWGPAAAEGPAAAAAGPAAAAAEAYNFEDNDQATEHAGTDIDMDGHSSPDWGNDSASTTTTDDDLGGSSSSWVLPEPDAAPAAGQAEAPAAAAAGPAAAAAAAAAAAEGRTLHRCTACHVVAPRQPKCRAHCDNTWYLRSMRWTGSSKKLYCPACTAELGWAAQDVPKGTLCPTCRAHSAFQDEWQ